MPTRREFLSLSARLAAGTGAMASIFGSIGRASEIEPEAGSSFLDAEHIVILMQENRSFDHTFGTLRGVRGFNDPRAISLPDGNPVWVQTDADGRQFAPFRFDIKNSKITWMGSLPHSWTDQVDARNNGLYDKWLIAKRSGHEEYGKMPLTLGYYTRDDIPFYYALADAFTVCDQYFCSSLTGTSPNRCYLWSGTIREKQHAESHANVRNENLGFNRLASWTTFPERLEDLKVAWKIYQNELTIDTGLTGEENEWLGNFDDNTIEYFRQYHVHLAPDHLPYLQKRMQELPAEIDALKKKAQSVPLAEREEIEKRIARLGVALTQGAAELAQWRGKSLDTLSKRDRSLHERAFVRNTGDPDFRKLTEIRYQDGDSTRQLNVPKGDLLHQFRADVNSGQLPAVSWVVAPEVFSDHPSSAWFGAWYIAEVLDILTQNPDVWKKTIFLLTYDENDGYFDHVPPFVAPHPRKPETGRVTKGIDASVEYVELHHDQKRYPGRRARESSIGLGYRVPMVVASPWSRGGCVCSQVFDHTSVLQLLEKVLSHKLGKKVVESNISRWRRTVCGDLTSCFQPTAKHGSASLQFPPKNEFFETIHRAQFRELPKGYHPLSPEEIDQIRRDPAGTALLPRQEPGTRPSAPLPYELDVDGSLATTRDAFAIRFAARKDVFGPGSAGAPFTVYALGSSAKTTVRNYAIEAGSHLDDTWPLNEFVNGKYHLRADGPNGFFREFAGSADDPLVELKFHYVQSKKGTLSGAIEIAVENRHGSEPVTIEIRDNAYGHATKSETVAAGKQATVTVETSSSAGWYDVSVRVAGIVGFLKRYAGRVETGNWSTSDPAMAGARSATA